MRNSYLVLYVPVLHEGYLKLFRKYEKKVDGLYLLGRSMLKEATFLESEIRAITDQYALRKMIQSLGIFPWVKILGLRTIKLFNRVNIITADEMLTRRVAEKYLKCCRVIYERTFLRWDERYVNKTEPVGYSRISTNPFDQRMMALAVREAGTSSDWWRQIGAVAVRGRKVVLSSHNQHVPSEYLPYALGDIRDYIKAGEHPEVSTALHAEQAVVVFAAERGISLAGSDLYVTTFPCTMCAKLVAYSGFRRCFFSGGHATFQGGDILRARGVEIVLVKK